MKGRIPEAVLAEIRRAHITRNKITEIWRRADEQIAALYETVPDVAAAKQAADAAVELVNGLREQIRARKQDSRTRRPDPELSARLTGAREESAAAKERLKAAKAAAREAESGQLTKIREDARAAIKDLYPQAVTGTLFQDNPVEAPLYPVEGALYPVEGALYWASFNMIAAQQETAMQQVIKLRTQHRPAELRFRRWDGSGTIAAQLQRQASDPPRTPAMLANTETGRWRNVVLLVPGLNEEEWAALPPCERKRAEMRIRVGGTGSESWETLRIVLHRPLPADADVALVQVTVRRVPNQHHGPWPFYEGSVAITVRLPDPAPRETGPAVAVHTGWRVLEDEAIRVAVIAGTGTPLGGTLTHTAPDGTSDHGIRDHGTWCEVVIPAGIRNLDAHARSLRSIRDREMNKIRAVIASHLADHPEHKETLDPGGTLDLWRSPARFTAAVVAARTVMPGSLLTEKLRQWERQDLHLASWQHHERSRHVTGWRKDLYKKVAAWITENAGTIILDEWPASRRRPADEEEDTRQAERARANAHLASPGDLRHAIKVAAERRGVIVQPAPERAAGVHHGCGGELPADERLTEIRVTCRRCGLRVDQDLNMLAAMIASAEVMT